MCSASAIRTSGSNASCPVRSLPSSPAARDDEDDEGEIGVAVEGEEAVEDIADDVEEEVEVVADEEGEAGTDEVPESVRVLAFCATN